MFKNNVIQEMKKIYHDNPYGIEHTLKVLDYAEAIMEGENLTEEEKEMISITAILHDIGIPEAKSKYGSTEAKYQEKEGAIIARNILERLEFDSIKTNRVCYIVGSHHTKSKIDGLDFQIIWEADLLVNLKDMNLTKKEIKYSIEENFKTEIGKRIAHKEYVVLEV